MSYEDFFLNLFSLFLSYELTDLRDPGFVDHVPKSIATAWDAHMIDTNSHPNHWAGSMSVYSQKEGQMFNVGAFLEMIPVCRSLHLASLRYCTCFDEIFLYFRQVALRSSRRTSKVDHGVRDRSANRVAVFFCSDLFSLENQFKLVHFSMQVLEVLSEKS